MPRTLQYLPSHWSVYLDFLSASIWLCLPLQLPSYGFPFIMFWPDSLFSDMLRSFRVRALLFFSHPDGTLRFVSLAPPWFWDDPSTPTLSWAISYLIVCFFKLIITWNYLHIIYWLSPSISSASTGICLVGWTLYPSVWHQAVAIRRWSVSVGWMRHYSISLHHAFYLSLISSRPFWWDRPVCEQSHSSRLNKVPAGRVVS